MNIIHIPTPEDIIATAHDDATLLDCLEAIHDDKSMTYERKQQLLSAIADRFNVLHPKGAFGSVAPVISLENAPVI